VFALLLPPAALANLIWLLVRPDAGSWRTLLCVYFLLQGALNAGVGVGVTDMMLGSSGTWYRSAYINVAFVANTLSAGLAPLVGSSIAALVADRTVGLGPFTFDAARVVFVLRCALAFAPLAILGGLSRRHGGHVSEAIQQLGLYVSGWLPFFRVGTGREDDEQED
jgi:hypothetical protein